MQVVRQCVGHEMKHKASQKHILLSQYKLQFTVILHDLIVNISDLHALCPAAAASQELCFVAWMHAGSFKSFELGHWKHIQQDRQGKAQWLASKPSPQRSNLFDGLIDKSKRDVSCNAGRDTVKLQNTHGKVNCNRVSQSDEAVTYSHLFWVHEVSVTIWCQAYC